MKTPRHSAKRRKIQYASGCGLLLACLVFIYTENQSGTPESTPKTASNTTPPQEAPSPRRPDRMRPPKGERGANAPSLSASADVARIISDTSLDNQDAARQVCEIAMDANRPIHERAEALEHALNLTESETPDLLMHVADHHDLPPALAKVLMQDAFSRPTPLQGRILLTLLQHKDKTVAAAAIEDLHLLTNEQHGSDRRAWQSAIDRLSNEQ